MLVFHFFVATSTLDRVSRTVWVGLAFILSGLTGFGLPNLPTSDQ